MKDYYPLPRINQLVNASCCNAFLSFTDENSGYHQVMMSKKDKQKRAFVTSRGVFNYKVMSFGLKNAGATFQRLMDKVFKAQKGCNVEIYVDDAIVKTKTEADLIRELRETFENI